MTEKDLPFLEEEEVVEEPQTEEPEAVEAVEPEPEPVEVEAEAEPEETGEKEPEVPPTPAQEQVQPIPVTALLDEREKRQKAERQLQAMQQQLGQLQKRQAQPAPDWELEPVQAAQHQAQTFQQQLLQQRVEQSRFMAEREFGKETVDKAVEFFNDPRYAAMSHQMMNEPSPFHAAVEFAQRQMVAEQVGSDPEAYRQKVEAEVRAQIEQEMLGKAPRSATPPPPSMAKAPSAGKGSGVSSTNTFDDMFPS